MSKHKVIESKRPNDSKYTIKDLLINDVSTIFAEIAPKWFKIDKSHKNKGKTLSLTKAR